MTEDKQKIAQIIQWLGDIIDIELDKPDEKVNMKLIDECQNLMNGLVNDSVRISDKQLNRKLVKLKKAVSSPKLVKHICVRKRAKLILIPLCVVLIFISTIGAISLNPAFREIIRAALMLSNGDSTNIDGITYIHGDTALVYSDLDTLLKSESLNIICPRNLPEDIWIEKIYTNGENLFPIQIIFNDTEIKYTVQLNNIKAETLKDTFESIQINNFTAYITEDDNVYYAILINDKYIYYCESNSKEKIYSILKSLS